MSTVQQNLVTWQIGATTSTRIIHEWRVCAACRASACRRAGPKQACRSVWSSMGRRAAHRTLLDLARQIDTMLAGRFA